MPEFIRVKDKNTKHEYDIAPRSFREARHERLDRKTYPDLSGPNARPRPVKHYTPPAQAKSSSASSKEK